MNVGPAAEMIDAVLVGIENRAAQGGRLINDVGIHDHTVVVVHDVDTGAMEHLEDFLDSLDALGAEVTQDYPEDCVPIRRGEKTDSFPLISL